MAFERWKVAKGGGYPGKEEAKVASPHLCRDRRGGDRDTRVELARSEVATAVAGLGTCAYPVIGELPVSEVMLGHVMVILEPIWNEKRETMQQIKQRVSAIWPTCHWGVA